MWPEQMRAMKHSMATRVAGLSSSRGTPVRAFSRHGLNCLSIVAGSASVIT